jgi:hypothetical protein
MSYREDFAFFKSPCQSPVKKRIHSSKSQKSYWLLRIMNKKWKWKENYEKGREIS